MMGKLLSLRFSEVAAGLLLFFAVSPLFFSIFRINHNDDFLQLSTRHLLLRKAVLEEGVLPLRTPYLNGGFPSIADPEDPALSPFSVMTVVFGEIAGLKLIALLLFFAGCAGMFLFLREVLAASRDGAALGAAVFGLSGWFVARMYSGNINELYYFLVPLLLLLLERFWSSGERRWCFYAAALFSVLLMDGEATVIVIALFLACYTVFRAAGLTGGKPALNTAILARLGLVLLLALGFSMVKVIPVLELFAAKGSMVDPVIDAHAGTYRDVVAFAYSDLVRGLSLPDTPSRAVSLYVGLAPLLIAAAGLVFGFRRVFPWAALGALFSVLWAGPNSPVDLFRALSRLPFFGTITQPHKYFDFFVVFCVCACLPAGFDAILARFSAVRARLSGALPAILWCAAVLPLFFFCFPKYARLYTLPAPELRAGEFFQVRQAAGELGGGRMYFNAAQNVGTINWYGAILLPSSVRPRYFVDGGMKLRPNPDYKGEVYCQGVGGVCQPESLGSNKMTVMVKTTGPDRVVFNQNYDARWKSSFGSVEDFEGLLSVKMPAAVPGETLVVRYVPLGFFAGLCVSLLAVVCSVVLCFPAARVFKRVGSYVGIRPPLP